MSARRFDGRVAVVTGAGRGIGRAYASLLVELGATVVVNDVDPDTGADDTNDVSTVEGAQGLIDATIERHGRVDALINNAGIIEWGGLPDVDAANIEHHIAVHTMGSFNTARAAWPHMAEQGYGRIVMTTSAGVFGLPTNTGYAAAKGGVIGLTRSLALTGRKAGIKVNAIAPAAATRMGGDVESEAMSPDLVAPMAAYLAHEDCPVSGEIYTAGAGRFARLFIASTPGHLDSAPSIQSVADNWAAINDETGYFVPADLMGWSAAFTEHLGRADA